MTNKKFVLTQEQKSLTWLTRLRDANATEEEARAFYEVCEEYGLNPLLGDIIFQKFEGKFGPRVSYLITRDALVKHAMRQDDFININSGVVKEGDYFELNVVDGVPIHRFGAKRGNILGSWAVIKTKSRENTVVFADFPEYHKALSGRNSVWRDMPSAMIEKVAQSMVIKRTFPLGVLFVSEDEVGQDFQPDYKEESTSADNPNTSLATEIQKASDSKTEDKNNQKTKNEKEGTVAKIVQIQGTDSTSQPKGDNAESETELHSENKETQQLGKMMDDIFSDTEETQEKVQSKETIEPTQQNSSVDSTSNIYEFINGTVKESPSSGNKFLIVQFLERGNLREVFVRGDDKIALFDEYQKGTKFTAEIQEHNGFSFVHSAQAV